MKTFEQVKPALRNFIERNRSSINEAGTTHDLDNVLTELQSDDMIGPEETNIIINNFCFSIYSKTANAVAAQTGFPPKVEAEGLLKAMAISSVVQAAEIGIPLPNALATVIISGTTLKCSMANHLPVRAKPV